MLAYLGVQRAARGAWESWWTTSAPVVNNAPLWPQLLLLLRCGARSEALALMQEASRKAELPPGVEVSLQLFCDCLDASYNGTAMPVVKAEHANAV